MLGLAGHMLGTGWTQIWRLLGWCWAHAHPFWIYVGPMLGVAGPKFAILALCRPHVGPMLAYLGRLRQPRHPLCTHRCAGSFSTRANTKRACKLSPTHPSCIRRLGLPASPATHINPTVLTIGPSLPYVGHRLDRGWTQVRQLWAHGIAALIATCWHVLAFTFLLRGAVARHCMPHGAKNFCHHMRYFQTFGATTNSHRSNLDRTLVYSIARPPTKILIRSLFKTHTCHHGMSLAEVASLHGYSVKTCEFEPCKTTQNATSCWFMLHLFYLPPNIHEKQSMSDLRAQTRTTKLCAEIVHTPTSFRLPSLWPQVTIHAPQTPA